MGKRLKRGPMSLAEFAKLCGLSRSQAYRLIRSWGYPKILHYWNGKHWVVSVRPRSA